MVATLCGVVSSRRTAPAAPLALLLVAVIAVASGCGLLGHRRTVDEASARRVLQTAVELALSEQLGQLCTLSAGRGRGEVSTCAETLSDTAALVPADHPEIRCAVPVGDDGPLRGGMVLVVEGTDANGDPFATEFVVYDDGSGIGVLDAVWWSGLSIRGYGEDTATWGFDSGSTLCRDGALPELASAGARHRSM